jgi:dihydroorotate dehydrogenase electron transfer subunit
VMLQRPARVLEHVQLAERTFRIRLEQPEIATAIRPGQFVMVKIPGMTDPLLGRPFAMYDTILDGDHPIAIDVVYLVVGKMTSQLMTVQPGETLELWGPLGNGFPVFAGVDHVVFVAGGIGQTPFLAYARELLGQRGFAGQPARQMAHHVSLYYGVRHARFAAGVADFEAAGCAVKLSSDDGSIGFHGYVTNLLKQDHPAGPFVGCGPEPMLKTLAAIAAQWQAECYVSLETPMACGFGACFSCVTPVHTECGRDYKRVCVEGPVFNAAKLAWD